MSSPPDQTSPDRSSPDPTPPDQGPPAVPAPTTVQILPLTGLPEITRASDLAAELTTAITAGPGLQDGDVLVVSSKLVSKAAGLRHPPTADRLALVREHSTRVVAERITPAGLTQVVEAVAGPVLAAAGIDASNTGPEGGFLVLPQDPDRAAEDLHAALRDALGRGRPGPVRFGVVLSDTAGRPWREGQTDFALGAYGVRVLDDLRGGNDADGRGLSVTARATGDEIAAAADLVKGKASGVGAAVLRGLAHLVTEAGQDSPADRARALTRTGPGDWFALGHREAVRAALGAAPGSAAAAQVGLPSVLPEGEHERAARAVRLALLGTEGVHVQGPAPDAGPPARGFIVHAGDDPVLAGRVAARLEVALAGEDVATTVRVVGDADHIADDEAATRDL